MLRNRLLVFLGCLLLIGIFAGGVLFKLAQIQNKSHENLARLEEITHYATTAQGLAMKGFARAFDVVTSAGESSGLEAEYLSLHGRIEGVFRAWEFALEELEEPKGGAKIKLKNYYNQVRREYRRLSGVFYQIVALKQHGQTEEALQVLKREHSEVLLQRFTENAEVLRFLHEEQGRELVRGIHKISIFAYATLGLFVLLVSVVAVLFIRRLLRSLNMMRHGVSLVARGSLTEQLSVDSKDEFGLLAQAFNTMTEEIRRSHSELVASDAYTHDIITSMVDSLFVVDRSGKLKTVNKATVDILGYTEKELIGQQVGMFLEEPEPEPEPVFLSKAGRLEELMQLGSVRDYGMVYATKSGEKIPMNLWTSSMRDREGEVKGIVGIARDMREINRLRKREKAFIAAEVAAEAERKRAGELAIFNDRIRQANEQLRGEITERERAEEELVRLNRQNELILGAAGEGIYGLDLNGNTTFVNPLAAQMIGWKVEELLGQSQHLVLHHSKPDGTPYPRETCPIYAAFKDGTVHHVINEVFWRKDGTSFPVEYTSTPIREQGKLTGAVVTFRDITERKQAEARTQASLKEKEVLLKEVHHRVKNNLQLISSLLNLQVGHERHDVRTMFQDSQHRVRAMAFIHEGLYSSDDLGRVPFAKYIRTLTGHLFQSYGVNPQRIALHTDMDPLTLGVDLAIPCGLMLNELVSNALKHAFPGDRRGEILVELHEDGAGHLVLRVGDNGIGIPPELDVRQSTTLGLQLVTTLTEQVGGTLDVERRDGTVFTLTCPREANGTGRG